jgi:hypothetical protein
LDEDIQFSKNTNKQKNNLSQRLPYTEYPDPISQNGERWDFDLFGKSIIRGFCRLQTEVIAPQWVDFGASPFCPKGNISFERKAYFA